MYLNLFRWFVNCGSVDTVFLSFLLFLVWLVELAMGADFMKSDEFLLFLYLKECSVVSCDVHTSVYLFITL